MTFNAPLIIVIHFPIDRVWHASVDPQDIARYMMGAHVTSGRKVGSPISWKGEWQGKGYEEHGTVLSARGPELLTYSHLCWSGRSARRTHHYHRVAGGGGSDPSPAYPEEHCRSRSVRTGRRELDLGLGRSENHVGRSTHGQAR